MKIFVSYSRENRDFIQDIKSLLPFHDVWIDLNLNHHIGADWQNEIKEQIESCDCLLFVLSQASIESAWCQRELKYAQELNKLIAPINIDNSSIPSNLSDCQIITIGEGGF